MRRNTKIYTVGAGIRGKNKSIKYDLGSVNEQGMQILFANLAHCTELETLSLKNTNLNKIMFAELNKLMKTIFSLPNLRELDLSGNNLDRLQISAIIHALELYQSNFNGLSIQLLGSTIDTTCKNRLAKLIDKGIEIVTDDEYSSSNEASPAAITYQYAEVRSGIEEQHQRTAAQPAKTALKY